MKKIVLFTVVTLLGITTSNAQEESNLSSEPQFGIKAGYSSAILKVSIDNTSATEDVSGFYIGAFGIFNMSEKIDVQPELHFATYRQDGESSAILLLPVLLKYNPNEKFGLLFGPQLDYIINDEDADGLKKLGLGLAIGASYDINENVMIDARYVLGLSNRIDGNLEGFEEYDLKAKFNYFQVGLGYRF